MGEKGDRMPNIVLSKVLEPSDQYEYREDVLELARVLKAMTDDAAVKAAAAASTIFNVAHAIDLDSEVLKTAIAPLADVLDQIEEAVDKIIKTVTDRREAFITPPQEKAEIATIIVHNITEKKE